MKYKAIIGVAFLFISSVVLAQQADTLTLSQAFKMALKQNVTLRKEQNMLRSSEAAAEQSFWNYSPRVYGQLQGSRQKGQQSQLVQDQLIVTNVTTDRIQANVTAELDLINGGARVSDQHMTHAALQAESARTERARETSAYDVAQQYLQILLDQELENIARENLQLQQKQLERIKGFVEKGIQPLSDQFAQEATVSRLQSALVKAINTRKVDQARLETILQYQPEGEWVAVTPDTIGLESYSASSLNTLQDMATSHRSDLRAAKYNAKSSMYNMRKAKSGYMPKLGFFFQYGSFYSSLDQLSFTDQIFNVYPTTTFGLQLQIPIFTQMTNKTLVTQRRITYENAQLDADQQTFKTRQEVKEAYLNYQYAKENLQATQKGFKSAAMYAKIQSEKYALGEANLIEYTDATQKEAQARADFAQAKLQLDFQKVFLAYQVGLLKL